MMEEVVGTTAHVPHVSCASKLQKKCKRLDPSMCKMIGCNLNPVACCNSRRCSSMKSKFICDSLREFCRPSLVWRLFFFKIKEQCFTLPKSCFHGETSRDRKSRKMLRRAARKYLPVSEVRRIQTRQYLCTVITLRRAPVASSPGDHPRDILPWLTSLEFAYPTVYVHEGRRSSHVAALVFPAPYMFGYLGAQLWNDIQQASINLPTLLNGVKRANTRAANGKIYMTGYRSARNPNDVVVEHVGRYKLQRVFELQPLVHARMAVRKYEMKMGELMNDWLPSVWKLQKDRIEDCGLSPFVNSIFSNMSLTKDYSNAIHVDPGDVGPTMVQWFHCPDGKPVHSFPEAESLSKNSVASFALPELGAVLEPVHGSAIIFFGQRLHGTERRKSLDNVFGLGLYLNARVLRSTKRALEYYETNGKTPTRAQFGAKLNPNGDFFSRYNRF